MKIGYILHVCVYGSKLACVHGFIQCFNLSQTLTTSISLYSSIVSLHEDNPRVRWTPSIRAKIRKSLSLTHTHENVGQNFKFIQAQNITIICTMNEWIVIKIDKVNSKNSTQQDLDIFVEITITRLG